jgi:crotonobetainyl-CoA:carnitine CoA-transferase CaiB-like acyl-CoA transferase
MALQSDVLRGIRVVEVAQFVFVPSAGAVLADLGADVLKVEHPIGGDPYRAMVAGTDATDAAGNARTALANRGKRSVGLDLKVPEGRAVLDRMLDDADVFLTSLRVDALHRLGLLRDQLLARNPNMIYARGDGFGARGPDRDLPGFDITAFWSRAGLGERMTTPGDPMTEMPGSIGDRTGALGLVAGVLSALFKRERTGEVPEVRSSLLSAGIWLLASDMVMSYATNAPPSEPTHPRGGGPYRTRDGRFIMMNLMQPERYWSSLCDVMDRPDLDRDGSRPESAAAQQVALRDAFAQQDYDYWCARLAKFDGPWAPMQRIGELPFDPQVVANDYTPLLDGDPDIRVVRPPFEVDEVASGLPAAPDIGENTEEVLAELGYAPDEIGALRELGAIG